MQLLVVQRLSQ